MGVELDLLPIAPFGEIKKRPVIISGPCSAESEEQVLRTAKELSKIDVKIFRAGIWKPRTRPNSFEGVGSLGLEWLRKVKSEFGMYTAVEVANVKHVYEALKFGVDILWIGARTTANPFAVQEIADALKGINIPVLVKNPINPDVELWIGAMERINKAGLKQLAVIHRGFSIHGKNIYRNDPQWQIPIEIRRRIPDLPIITDPSHICGNRDMLYQVSQEAMDLNFDGLIIESHINPANALSDSKQQVTPDELNNILNRLVLREAKMNNKMLVTIDELRKQIDNFDDELIDVFEKRMNIVEQIARYKKENNITILQTNRWNEIIQNRTIEAEKRGLSKDFITKVLQAIHQESINKQTEIMNQPEEDN
jgi:chorismate mutase